MKGRDKSLLLSRRVKFPSDFAFALFLCFKKFILDSKPLGPSRQKDLTSVRTVSGARTYDRLS